MVLFDLGRELTADFWFCLILIRRTLKKVFKESLCSLVSMLPETLNGIHGTCLWESFFFFFLAHAISDFIKLEGKDSILGSMLY